MRAFMDENFLLTSETASLLYHDYARHQPIYDYHCHLNPREIADDRRFDNLGQLWLEADHYKWRAMRTAGVDERLISGDAGDWEKYLAWANVVPQCIGNPIYHWTHLELRRPFGIEGLLFNPENAPRIWTRAGEMLAQPEFSARGILRQMNVKLVGTTDDPVDSLEHHRHLMEIEDFDTEVVPSWRPDRVFKIDQPGFADYLAQLERAADIHIAGYADLQRALQKRMDHFAAHGCRCADHGIEILRYAPVPDESALSRILAKARDCRPLSEEEIAQFATALQVFMAREYCARGWAMQLHIGALRNNNSRLFRALGRDIGCDSINDRPFAEPLARLLDAMDSEGALPKTILYTLNPAANAMLATMCGNFQGGNFQGGGIAGKIQFGSGWWFNDQKDGMQQQLEQLAQLGLLSRFIGMLTDSRSFLSFTRHEYFRRILCDKIGRWVEDGEAPNDLALLGGMVENICYHNARRYFAGAAEVPKP